MPRDALNFINLVTQHWMSDIGREAASAACLCTYSAYIEGRHKSIASAITISITMEKGNPETINWATQHLQQYLPAPSTPSTTLAQTDMNNATFAHPMVTMAQQLLQTAAHAH